MSPTPSPRMTAHELILGKTGFTRVVPKEHKEESK